jgi:hypothetical protein
MGKVTKCMEAKVATPLPVPVTVVNVPLLNIFIRFLEETVASFTQAKKDKLCADLINAAQYDPSLINCQVSSVVPSESGRRKLSRFLLQSGGVNVTTEMTFTVADAGEVDSAFAAASNLTVALSDPTQATEIIGQNSTVEGVDQTTESEIVPVDPPPPSPPSPPPAPTAPYDPVATASTACAPGIVVSWKAPGFSSNITEYFVSCTSSVAAPLNATVAAAFRQANFSTVAGAQYTCSIFSKGPSGTSTPATASPVTYRYELLGDVHVDDIPFCSDADLLLFLLQLSIKVPSCGPNRGDSLGCDRSTVAENCELDCSAFARTSCDRLQGILQNQRWNQ